MPDLSSEATSFLAMKINPSTSMELHMSSPPSYLASSQVLARRNMLPNLQALKKQLVQALQIMNFRESGDQDNDHEGNSEEVVIKIMITRKFLESGDQDNDHGVYS
jgi:hypothetical protein